MSEGVGPGAAPGRISRRPVHNGRVLDLGVDTVRFPDGTESTLKVAAIYDTNDVVGNYVIGVAAWEPHSIENFDSIVLVKLNDGVSLEEGRAAFQRYLAALERIIQATAPARETASVPSAPESGRGTATLKPNNA